MMAMMAMTSCTAQNENDFSSGNKTEVVEEIMMSRRSIRQYTDRKVERSTLDKILECGINAPNGQNRQAYEIRVVDDTLLLEDINAAVKKDNPQLNLADNPKTIFNDAPCVIFIANDTTYRVSQIDCGLLGENIILSAWSRGIGSCCMAYPTMLMSESPSCKPIIDRLGFSQGYSLLYCITIGYPAETPDAKQRRLDKIKYVE